MLSIDWPRNGLDDLGVVWFFEDQGECNDGVD